MFANIKELNDDASLLFSSGFTSSSRWSFSCNSRWRSREHRHCLRSVLAPNSVPTTTSKNRQEPARTDKNRLEPTRTSSGTRMMMLKRIYSICNVSCFSGSCSRSRSCSRCVPVSAILICVLLILEAVGEFASS